MPKSMRRFVILHHRMSAGDHWDLMFERGETLATWQLLSDPRGLLNAGNPAGVPARRIGDHRRAYLDYQGPVSGGRGEVTRIEQGTYQLVEEQERRWTVRFDGGWLRGEFELAAPSGAPDEWELIRRAVGGPAAGR